MQLWLATSNKNKINEFKNMLSQLPLEIRTPFDLPTFSFPKETGDSFFANAKIKASALRSLKPNDWVVGEDSGLEVAGLNNMPGIHSARYAGEKASDHENIAKLLKMISIRCAKNREAQFVCSMHIFSPQGETHQLEGVLKGSISLRVKGSQGFGYDPVFIPEGSTDQTLAEMGAAEKNKISHRAQAIQKLKEILKTHL